MKRLPTPRLIPMKFSASRSSPEGQDSAVGAGRDPVTPDAWTQSEFCQILDEFGIAMMMCASDGKLCQANQVTRALLGLPEGDFDLEQLSQLAWFTADTEEAISSDGPFPWHETGTTAHPEPEKVMRLRRPDGVERIIAFGIRTLGPSPQGDTKKLVRFLDITEERELKESLRFQSHLLEASQAIAGMGGWELNLETSKLFWTDQTYRLLDTSPAEHVPTMETGLSLYLQESQSVISKALEVAQTKGEGYDLELELQTFKGRHIFVRNTCEVTCRDGRPIKLTGTFQDISHAKHAEAALREAAQFAQDTLDSLDANICVLDDTGTIVAVNQRWRDLAGPGTRYVQPQELNYLKVCDAVQGEAAAKSRKIADGIRSVIRGELAIFYDEYPCEVTGQPRWFAMRASRFSSPKKSLIAVAHSDITDRHEARLQLQELNRRLYSATEEESRRIGRLVHDELGQQLTGLKMDLRAIEKLLGRAEADPCTQALRRTREATALVDDAVRTVQKISEDLRPVVLDQLGLWSALREEVRRFSKRSELRCRLEMPDLEPKISEALSTAVYRIVREALTNIFRHARGTKASVVISIQGSELIVRISDNGRGIDPQQLHHPGSMGVIGMRERALQLGGALSLFPLRRGGTTVRAVFPLQLNNEPEGGR
jgi:PAS domain S-box-containing protein